MEQSKLDLNQNLKALCQYPPWPILLMGIPACTVYNAVIHYYTAPPLGSVTYVSSADASCCSSQTEGAQTYEIYQSISMVQFDDVSVSILQQPVLLEPNPKQHSFIYR